MAFSPLARRCPWDSVFLVGFSDGPLRTYDAATAAELHTFAAPDACTFAAISVDGSLLAAGSESGEVRIWER